MFCAQSRERFLAASALFMGAVLAAGATLQGSPLLHQAVTEIKQAAAANKASLARYTWQQKQTVSVNGEVNKEALYQVRLGPDGKPEKTLIMSTSGSANRVRGPLRRRFAEKKKEEFTQYARQVRTLAASYARPSATRIEEAYSRGDVMFGPSGIPGELAITVRNYIKRNDSVRFILNRAKRAIQTVEVSSYLANPQDAVTMNIRFAKLPDGTSHVADMTIHGVEKQLTIRNVNSNYVKAQS